MIVISLLVSLMTDTKCQPSSEKVEGYLLSFSLETWVDPSLKCAVNDIVSLAHIHIHFYTSCTMSIGQLI